MINRGTLASDFIFIFQNSNYIFVILIQPIIRLMSFSLDLVYLGRVLFNTSVILAIVICQDFILSQDPGMSVLF